MTSSVIRPALAVVAAAIMALAGCSFEPEKKVWEISGPVFGTRYTVDLVLENDPDRLRNLADGIKAVLETVDSSMSTWRPDSELSRFNTVEDQSEWFPISQPLYEVLAAAHNISKLSDGAFDVTVGPVVNLWGFGPEARPDTVPDDAALASVLASVGYETLELREEPPAVRSSKRQYIDLSAIAKGYAVDAVAEYLAAEGANAFLVEIGGEVRAHGRKPGEQPWRLAVEEPVEQARQVNRIVVLEDQAMATSGDYRNYYEVNGRRFSHTIDPETGRPIKHKLASVTVIVENCTMADGLATAFNVMGHEKAMALATRLNLAAYFIVRGESGFETYQTPAFSSYIVD
ncbi:MAG: FAD:protein FMN transferase [Marinobacter sp.]|uniref:FAD:protein FMN transferase n=1 Tax=Marinobacter sp. TaxID=50741 RepID=UPI00299D709B|nr:FAD:protein FMN transferase [Marinobacter sp.]MDX1633375.1 FAD:protein FMN transferase [Marinobacter sp.]